MMLVVNILLAIVWSLATGSFTATNLALGFVVGYGLLVVFPGRRRSQYVRRTWACVALAAFATYELVLANLRVAWYTVSNLRSLEPAILAIPLRPDLSDGEVSLLAILVTLTPGTLSLDLADDRRSLFVHFMHVDDPEQAVRTITEGFERRILELTR